jgi:hypothetical protein
MIMECCVGIVYWYLSNCGKYDFTPINVRCDRFLPRYQNNRSLLLFVDRYFVGEISLISLEVWSFLQIPPNVQKFSLTLFELSIVLNLNQSVQIMTQNFLKRLKYS